MLFLTLCSIFVCRNLQRVPGRGRSILLGRHLDSAEMGTTDLLHVWLVHRDWLFVCWCCKWLHWCQLCTRNGSACESRLRDREMAHLSGLLSCLDFGCCRQHLGPALTEQDGQGHDHLQLTLICRRYCCYPGERYRQSDRCVRLQRLQQQYWLWKFIRKLVGYPAGSVRNDRLRRNSSYDGRDA